MSTNTATDSIRSKLVVKAVRNIRKAGQKEDAEKGMYRPEIKLDLQRSILITESYKETEVEPMVMRRAKALERVLTRMDLYIQDHERIVGNSMSTPQGIYFGIDMNWRSVRRIVDEPEGHTLLDKGNWGYRSYESKAALTAAYLEKIEMLKPMIKNGLAAAIYTQISDVEVEVNGLLTYEREILKMDPEVIGKANAALYEQ